MDNFSNTTDESNTDVATLLANLRPAKSTSNSRSSGPAGIISIINSDHSGKRLSLAAELMSELDNPETVQVSFTDTELTIGESIPGCINNFTVKKNGKKGLVYAANLVVEICDNFDLDFSDKTSMTFQEVRYVTIDDNLIALITMA